MTSPLSPNGSIRLLAKDVQATYKFYRDVLGFPAAFDDEGGVYAEVKVGESTIAFFGRDLMAQAIGAADLPAPAMSQDRVALIFEVANVDETVKALTAKGVNFLGEPKDMPLWQIRVAFFRDPDSNLIEINHGLPRE